MKKAEKELDLHRIAMEEMEAALAELDKITDQLEYESAIEVCLIRVPLIWSMPCAVFSLGHQVSR